MNRISSGVLLLLTILLALPAWATDAGFVAHLNGDYAFVQTRVCSQGAPGAPGINDNLVLLSPNSLRTTGLRGLMSFDGAAAERSNRRSPSSTPQSPRPVSSRPDDRGEPAIWRTRPMRTDT
jgi:hypothetical protein